MVSTCGREGGFVLYIPIRHVDGKWLVGSLYTSVSARLLATADYLSHADLTPHDKRTRITVPGLLWWSPNNRGRRASVLFKSLDPL